MINGSLASIIGGGNVKVDCFTGTLDEVDAIVGFIELRDVDTPSTDSPEFSIVITGVEAMDSLIDLLEGMKIDYAKYQTKLQESEPEPEPLSPIALPVERGIITDATADEIDPMTYPNVRGEK